MNYEYLKIGEKFPSGNPYLNPDTTKIFLQKMDTLDYGVEDKVKYCLSLFGWTGEKRPEAELFLQDMATFHYYLFPAARIFLDRFGGLQIYDGKDKLTFLQEYPFDIYDFSFLEAFQIFKNELLVPVIKLDEMEIFLAESGNVYYWGYDLTGVFPGDLFSVLSSMVFHLDRDLWLCTTREERQEVLWWDQNLMDHIENETNAGTYIPYAQKRFAQNAGIPNPMTGRDAFTQWLLSFD